MFKFYNSFAIETDKQNYDETVLLLEKLGYDLLGHYWEYAFTEDYRYIVVSEDVDGVACYTYDQVMSDESIYVIHPNWRSFWETYSHIYIGERLENEMALEKWDRDNPDLVGQDLNPYEGKF